MRVQTKSVFGDNCVIHLKDDDWLVKQRKAGKVVADTLTMLQKEVLSNTSLSLLELNKMGEDFIYSHDCTPTFKNYKGFPAGVCISVNKQLVHGIPTDYHLQDGDVVSFDLGATYEGAIADSALTCIYGNPKSAEHLKLIIATEDCLIRGIKAIKVGERLGSIGHAIAKCAKGHGFGLVTQYGGHGITWNTPHSAPFVANKSELNEGIRIASGLTLAIEPMLIIGDTKTTVDNDGWTVRGMGISAHCEHTVYIHEDRVEIITDRNVA